MRKTLSTGRSAMARAVMICQCGPSLIPPPPPARPMLVWAKLSKRRNTHAHARAHTHNTRSLTLSDRAVCGHAECSPSLLAPGPSPRGATRRLRGGADAKLVAERTPRYAARSGTSSPCLAGRPGPLPAPFVFGVDPLRPGQGRAWQVAVCLGARIKHNSLGSSTSGPRQVGRRWLGGQGAGRGGAGRGGAGHLAEGGDAAEEAEDAEGAEDADDAGVLGREEQRHERHGHDEGVHLRRNAPPTSSHAPPPSPASSPPADHAMTTMFIPGLAR